MTGIRYIVMLVCSDVRDAHMCSNSTRAQYEVKRGHDMKKIGNVLNVGVRTLYRKMATHR